MDLFAELDRAPAVEPSRPRLSRAAKDALAKKRREESERLPAAAERIRAIAPGAPADLQCRPPCPTVLAAPDELGSLCAACRWSMARAGIVVGDAG